MTKFDREEHVYRSKEFEEIIKDTIRFFNGTPVHVLPPPQKFAGTGVYALYYTGRSPLYDPFYEINRTFYNLPIYIGKAVPEGWRQGRVKKNAAKFSNELNNRLNQHARSIVQVDNLDLEDFKCRFMILEDEASNLISVIEAALIREYLPLWNTSVDGFGNHDPGKGRYNQARSNWDIIHKGRPWADKCLGLSSTASAVESAIESYFKNLKDK